MRTIIGVFSTHESAEHAIHELRAIETPEADISYIYTNAKGNTTNSQAQNTVGAETVSGGTSGAIVGALAGLAVANGILPGLGSLFVAGPLAIALGFTGAAATTVAGAATGAAAGGFIGALNGFGLNESDARLYEETVRSGDILVIVRANTDSPMMFKDIFAKSSAKKVGEYF